MLKRLHIFVCFLAFTVIGQAAHKDLKPGWNLFSKEQDVQLGREAAAQVEQQMQVVRDTEIQRYVESIGRRLSSAPEADKYPYSFKVVNDPSINAFALPGGPTFVHTGLIKAAENEAQLAGVMAHEIAHVALRHGTNQASKANLLQLPAMLAGAVVGNGGLMGQLTQLGIGLGFNSVLLKYSRDAERQADLLGAQMMARAGYNPIEMARFFEKLAAQGGRSGPQFLSSHPDPGNRMKAVQEEIQTLPQRNYTLGDNAELKQIQSRLGSLPAAQQSGTRTRQGVVSQGDPRPSGRFREFRSSAFSLSHPDNWEVFGDQGGVSATIAPRSGLVRDSNGGVAVGYGVMVNGFTPPRSGNLSSNTQDLIAQLRQSNPAMQVSGRQKQTQINGQSAIVTTLLNQSPLGGREIDMLVTVSRPEGLLYMVFIAPEQDWQQMQPVYEQMLRSVRF